MPLAGTALAVYCHRVPLWHDAEFVIPGDPESFTGAAERNSNSGGKACASGPAVRRSPVRDTVSRRRSYRNYSGRLKEKSR